MIFTSASTCGAHACWLWSARALTVCWSSPDRFLTVCCGVGGRVACVRVQGVKRTSAASLTQHVQDYGIYGN